MPNDPLAFTWRGQTYHLQPSRDQDGNEGRPLLDCPRCGRLMYIAHVVTPGPNGVTLTGGGKPDSLVCAYGCGWHVHIRDGVASDS